MHLEPPFKKKKICFFVGSIGERGGTERVTTLIANGLSERGYEIEILSLWDGLSSGYALSPSIKLSELFKERQKFKWKYLDIIRRIRKYLKEHHPDILISTDTILTLYSAPACYKKKVTQVAWEHFNFFADLKIKARLISRYIAARMVDAVIVLTKEDLAVWKKKVSGRAKIVSIPNPVTFPPLEPQDRTWDNRLAIAVGRFTYQKGFDLLIQCWEKVATASPDWKLYIIGEGEDEVSLRKQIKEGGLAHVISVLPFNQDISAYYRQASIFCLPSRFEGLPMVLLEAQSFGLPSVCFNCYTGPSDVINEGENGFVVRGDDLAGFSDRVIQLTENPALRAKIGLKALENARLFQKEPILDQWDKLFQNALRPDLL